MCELCQLLCDMIAQTFGHTVNPNLLSLLIEESPLETKPLKIERKRREKNPLKRKKNEGYTV